MSKDRISITADVLAMSIEEIKHSLDMRFLMERFEHPLVRESKSGKSVYTYHAWSREDTNPSFDVWYEADGRGWHYNDPAEPDAGDVLDLIGKLLTKECPNVGHQLRYAREALIDMLLVEWVAPEPRPREPFSPQRVLKAASGDNRDATVAAVVKMCQTWNKPMLTPDVAPELVDKFRLGYDADTYEVLIPIIDHRSGDVLGAKRRRVGSGGKISEPGSDLLTDLYGAWRLLSKDTTVLLCEGESDTWAAVAAGFPAVGVLGAGIPPNESNTACLDGREVIVCFDGDRVGLAAAALWAAALPNARIAPIPQGSDVSDLDYDTFVRVVDSAEPLQPLPENVTIVNSIFHKVLRSGETRPISSFGLDPLERLGDSGWRCTMTPRNIEVVVPREASNNDGSLHRWASQHRGSFNGSTSQAREVGMYLDALSTARPSVSSTDQLGYVEGSFVWKDGHLGQTPVVWVQDRDIPEHRFTLDYAEYDPGTAVDTIHDLHKIHSPEVIEPLMGWAAAATFRPQFSKFPVLGVFGASGTGKTTITEAVLDTLTGAYFSHNLTSTTAFGVSTLFDLSCGIPVWFDEFRNGARDEARQRLEQHIRDAFDGAPSVQGTGGAVSGTRSFRTIGAYAISGEDFVNEKSQLERMVVVQPTHDGQNAHALASIEPRLRAITARTFMEWAYHPNNRHTFELVGYNRVEISQAAVTWGWNLINRFLEEMGGRTLPAEVTFPEEYQTEHETMRDALIIAHEVNAPLVLWRTPDGWWAVSPSGFVNWVRSNNYDITLPGGNRAVRAALRAIPGSLDGRVANIMGDVTRVVLLPPDLISTKEED